MKNNVKQMVPFFWVSDMEKSLRFYTERLEFEIKIKWEPDGKIRWCWLELGPIALMLQEYKKAPEGSLGTGVSLCVMCDDAIAIYHTVTKRGLDASEPQVGNRLWVTSLKDPDGYRIDFESPTDVPEETKLSEWKS